MRFQKRFLELVILTYKNKAQTNKKSLSLAIISTFGLLKQINSVFTEAQKFTT